MSLDGGRQPPLQPLPQSGCSNEVAFLPEPPTRVSALGGNISKPVTGETTYTLSCLALDGRTLTKSATVKIIPTFQEI